MKEKKKAPAQRRFLHSVRALALADRRQPGLARLRPLADRMRSGSTMPQPNPALPSAGWRADERRTKVRRVDPRWRGRNQFRTRIRPRRAASLDQQEGQGVAAI